MAALTVGLARLVTASAELTMTQCFKSGDDSIKNWKVRHTTFFIELLANLV